MTHTEPMHVLTSAAEASAERELLQRLTQGDITAFSGLWEQYQGELFSRCCRRWMAGNRDDAEDALSSAGLKAWQYLPNAHEEIRSVKGWLTRLLQNQCRDMWRAEQRRRVYLMQSGAVVNGMVLAQESAEDAVLRHELNLSIHSAIASLPPRLREPCRLRFFLDMPCGDIAAQLNLDPANVRKRLQQARALLQEELAGYCSGNAGVKGEPLLTSLVTPPRVAQGDGVAQVVPEQEDIPSPSVTTRLLLIRLAGGVERQVYLALGHKPVRQRQKIETLRTYVHKHPSGWKKHLALAEMLYTQGHWQEAMAIYRQVTQKQPRCLAAWLQLGDMLHHLGREDEAIAVYEHALPYASAAPTQHHVQGLLAACQRQPAAALQAFAAAASLQPDNVAHWQALGLTHLDADHPIEAVDAFAAALQRRPDDLITLTRSHAALCMLGRHSEAERHVTRALAIAPDHVLALTLLAEHRSRKRWVQGEAGKQTRELIRRALHLAPEAPDVQASLAHYYISRGEWSRGLATLQRCVHQHPHSPDAWYHYAHGSFRTGRTPGAATAIMRAYQLEPNRVAILRAAGDILHAAGRHRECTSVLEDMLQRFPAHWSVQASAARLLVQHADAQERACIISARGTELQPQLAPAWFSHGYVLKLASRYHEAIAAFTTGWTRLPHGEGYAQATPAALWLGECYWASGNLAKALAWCKKAARLARKLMPCDPAMAFYWQGKAWLALGETAAARQALQSALLQQLLYPARQEAQHILTCRGKRETSYANRAGSESDIHN